MTNRDINGDAVRSKYRKAQKKIAELGLTPEVVEMLAEGVREFDAERDPEARQVKALERIATNTAPPRERQDSWAWEEQRLRRREVYAQELMAVAVMQDDIHDDDLVAIRQSPAFQRLVERLKGEPGTVAADAPGA